MFEGWMAEMAAWSEGGDAPGKLKAFSQSGIKLNKGAAAPQHAAFAAIDDWLYAGEEAAPTAAKLRPLLLRHALVHVQRALELEKQRRAELGFDDLLQRLDAALQRSLPWSRTWPTRESPRKDKFDGERMSPQPETFKQAFGLAPKGVRLTTH